MAEISVRVVPNARRSESVGVMADGMTWKIRIAAPAVEGKANKALIEFLAKACGVSKSDVTVLAGAASRHKRVAIAGLDQAQVRARLDPGPQRLPTVTG